MDNINKIISNELNIKPTQVNNVIDLLNQGATIPFISRYRKELTGSLDEVAIGKIKERYEKLLEIEKRKDSIIKSMEEQEVLTPELLEKIKQCYNSVELEDIYLPFKPKRKTRASIAKSKGLEPLAKILMKQYEKDVNNIALKFLNKDVESTEDALSGARDIIAEHISENATVRDIVRNVYSYSSIIESKLTKGKDEEGAKYKDYFDFSESLKKCPSHRVLAMLRAQKESILKVNITADTDRIKERLHRFFIKGNTEASEQVKMAIDDAVKRLIEPSIANEFINEAKIKADEAAIKVFAKNLKQLLLAPPLGHKRVLAIDPGFRTGCKVVCLDQNGMLLHNENIYPHAPQNEYKQAMRKVTALVDSYKTDAIAIGNGTASRETENFIHNCKFSKDIQVFVVSEDGASVYSASKIAREEFGNYDVTVRGAVSIGRRLIDPLAELVKIDPKSIGVGQYQHDVDQTKLRKSLDTVVESCVNKVGVNLNTAGIQLLTYVSGVGPSLAKNIVSYRDENGEFNSRAELKKVPRFGAKAYEQAAGFLRIPNAKNILDNSAVHPESYFIVTKMAKDLGCKISDLISNNKLRNSIDLNSYVTEKVGLPTLKDIISELEKPGRDPRKQIKVFEFDKNIKSISDLKIGYKLNGIVTNITNFGAFIDIGIKQKGLIHISQITDKFISAPSEVLSLHQHVKVRVLDVDENRNRIALTMKDM